MIIHKLSKKAQSEIIGIAIVMVLIMLGIVFVINFVIMPSDSSNIKVQYDRVQMASNAISSILKTTTSCNKLTITELLQDCAEKHGDLSSQYLCPANSILTGSCSTDSCHSCEYMNESLNYMFENAINPLMIRYDFYICQLDEFTAGCMDNTIMTSINHMSCQGSNVTAKDSKQTPIPTNVGNRIAKMDICGFETG
jgi:hypothetical protein